MTNGLNKTWNDTTTGAGALKVVLVLGMSIISCFAMMIMACGILVYEPNLLLPIMIALSVTLVALPLLGEKFFDFLASQIVNFSWVAVKSVRLQPVCDLSVKLISIKVINLPTPFSPPRRTA